MEAYQPLYLKYRPQSLADLVGQRTVAQTLTNAIDHEKIAHAYLFTGPRGTGKTSSARILAKSLNCQRGTSATPCLECTSCKEIAQSISPSVMEIDAASNNSVDDARTLIERAPLAPPGGSFKLYIIDECHMLTKEAFNALLKTIEEPPPRVIFVLATTEEHKVPPTIVSRCQRLMFRLVNQSELAAYLRKIAEKEKISVTDEALELLARRSGGGLRDALGLLDQASLLSSEEKPVTVEDLLALVGALQEEMLLKISEGVRARDGGTVLSLAHQLLMEGREPALIALELSKHFLNLSKASYIAATSASATDVQAAQQVILGSPSYVASALAQSKTFDRTELAQMIEELERIEQTCRRSTQPALNLETGLLSLCHRLEIMQLRELEGRIEALERAAASEGINLSRPGDAARTGQSTATKPRQTPAAPPRQIPAAAPPEAPASATNKGEFSLAAPPAVLQGSSQTTATLPDSSNAPDAVSTISTISEDNEAGESAHDYEAEELSITVSPDTEAADAYTESGAELAGLDRVELRAEPSIEEFWSNMLDILKERNVPTYSIVSMHAFPIALTEEDLTIGVRLEHFQKLIDGKSEHIKAASKDVIGRQLSVRVKVITDGAPKPPHGREPATKERKSSTAKSSDSDESEGAQLPPKSQPPPSHHHGLPTNVETPCGAPTKERQSEVSAAKPTSQLQPALKSQPLKSNGGDNPHLTLIQEAYKLFEGPGSRLYSADSARTVAID